MLKVGIIGCGSIAKQRHAAEYAANPESEIAGFYDLTRARAEALQKAYGGAVYESYEAMLADKSIDAVSVCTANHTHAMITIAALEAGKHVLCEKPMATSLEDCRAMVAASQRTGKKLMLGHNQRLTDAHVAVKNLLDSGEMGRVITFATAFGHGGPEMWSMDKGLHTWFFKKDQASIGSMADLGIHKIDLMRFLIGGRVTSVMASITTLDKRFADGGLIEVDDNAQCVLRFDNGAMGTVTTSWTHYGEEDNSTALYCEKGIVKVYLHPEYPVEVVFKNCQKRYYEMGAIQTNDDAVQASSGVIDAFVECIVKDTTPIVSGEEGLKTMEVVFACIESSETGAAVNL